MKFALRGDYQDEFNAWREEGFADLDAACEKARELSKSSITHGTVSVEDADGKDVACFVGGKQIAGNIHV